jgi:hypothetical protein
MSSALIAQALAKLIEESPSMKAAMKAGKKTGIRIRIQREGTTHWDDYGVVSQNGSEGWGAWLKGKLGITKLIYTIGGHKVDEVDL